MPLLINQQQAQLLVIDQQTRLAAVMNENDWPQVEKHSARLLQAAAALDVPSLISEQYPRGLGSTIDNIKDSAADSCQIIEKTQFSCCQNPNLKQQLIANNRKQLIICGIEAHVCVLQTAFDALVSGFDVFVVEDAVCSRSTEHKQNALQRMRQAGVVITNHESVLFEWLRDAQHEQFKFISGLLK